MTVVSGEHTQLPHWRQSFEAFFDDPRHEQFAPFRSDPLSQLVFQWLSQRTSGLDRTSEETIDSGLQEMAIELEDLLQTQCRVTAAQKNSPCMELVG